MALCPGLLPLEPLAFLVEATLPGFLLSCVVVFGVGHGGLLRFVVAPWFSLGGDHDPFFMSIQALSWTIDCSSPSGAASEKERTSQNYILDPPSTARRVVLTQDGSLVRLRNGCRQKNRFGGCSAHGATCEIGVGTVAANCLLRSLLKRRAKPLPIRSHHLREPLRLCGDEVVVVGLS